MAYGGHQVGNHDPEAIAARAKEIQELTGEELLAYWQARQASIGDVILDFSLVSLEIPGQIEKLSDRLQHPIPADDPERVEVIEVLSGNIGFYDDISAPLVATDEEKVNGLVPNVEDAIDRDPIATKLSELKREADFHARTWRLRRSLVALINIAEIDVSSLQRTPKKAS